MSVFRLLKPRVPSRFFVVVLVGIVAKPVACSSSPSGQYIRYEQRFVLGDPVCPARAEAESYIRDELSCATWLKTLSDGLDDRQLVATHLLHVDSEPVITESRRCSYQLTVETLPYSCSDTVQTVHSEEGYTPSDGHCLSRFLARPFFADDWQTHGGFTSVSDKRNSDGCLIKEFVSIDSEPRVDTTGEFLCNYETTLAVTISTCQYEPTTVSTTAVIDPIDWQCLSPREARPTIEKEQLLYHPVHYENIGNTDYECPILDVLYVSPSDRPASQNNGSCEHRVSVLVDFDNCVEQDSVDQGCMNF